MDKKYMLLSNVPFGKPPSTIKKKFGKLTLKQENPETDPRPGPSMMTSQRKLSYHADESILTDDEELDEMEMEKENKILNSQPDSPERVDLVGVTVKQRYSEAITTVSEELEIEMSKLEITFSDPPLTDDQKLSETLFNTESTEDPQQQVMVVKPEPVQRESSNYSQNDSIVTISSTNSSTIIEAAPAEAEKDASDTDDDDPVIILDDDEEEEEKSGIISQNSLQNSSTDEISHFSGTLPSKSSEPNCSAANPTDPGDLLTSSVMRRLSDFFNKIPDLEEPPQEVDLTIDETPPQSPIQEAAANDSTINNEEDQIILPESSVDISVIENSVVEEDNTPLPSPPHSSAFIPPPVSSKKDRPAKSSQDIEVTTQVGDGGKVLNFAATIKVDIVIRTQEASSSEESEADEDEEDGQMGCDNMKQESEDKNEEPVIIKRESSEETRKSSDNQRDSVGSAETDKSQSLGNKSDENENVQRNRRTSTEIAMMDTLSNSPAVVLREQFIRFRDTPKGRVSRLSERNVPMEEEEEEKQNNEKVAEMDTILNSTFSGGLEEKEIQNPMGSRELAEMDTEINTEEVEQQQEPPEIELDEASIAILHSIYGDGWQTPQLMKSMKRTTSSASRSASIAAAPPPNYSSFSQSNMTDFQKFNANIRRDLESTRVERLLSVQPASNRNSGSIKKTKSVDLPPKSTPLPSKTLLSKQASDIVQSPYFSNKKKPTTTTTRNLPLRTPLKETPKYRKILQVVDTDTSDEEDDEVFAQSDDSYKINENDSDSDSDSDSTKSSSSSTDGNLRKRGARGGGASSKQPRKKPQKKGNSRKEMDFTQIASSDSELEDSLIFIDRDAIVQPIQIKEEQNSLVVEGGKRKLFSDLNYNTPTSSVSSPEEEKEEKDKHLKKQLPPPKELRFPWLHDFTPVRNKTLDKLKNSPAPRPVGQCGFLASLDMKIGKAIADPQAVVYRELYKQKREELAVKLFAIYDEKVFSGALAAVPLKWNKKLLTTAGRCVNMAKFGKRMAEVELSEKVLTSADRLRCTLIHEMCHAAAWLVDGEKKGHAGHWKRWTERAVKALPELPRITVRHDYNIEYKYTYQCTKCAAKSEMHSKTKKAETIRCRFCHGDIEILLNKRSKTGEVFKTPVRAASGFALFVKENYKKLKQPQLKHADVMKLLSQNFAEMKVVVQKEGE